MSSLKLEQEVLQHFTHVHPLTKVYDFGGFICNGCNTYGSGKTYRCASCNYDLHDCCATCPRTLHCFVHPQHELTLVFKEPAKMDHDRRGCNICHELAEGLYYQCEACGFDMHPLCSQLPQQVSHMSHPAHYLELSDHGASNMCMECHGVIRSWRYKCGPCRLDVHMECVNSSTSATKGTQQRSLEPQPYFQPSQYHQPQSQPQVHLSQYQQMQPQTYFHPPQYHQPQTYFHPPQYQQPQPYFHPNQQPQPYFQPSQYQLPCHNHGCTNQGQPQGQQSGRSAGKKMFGIFMALTIGVASDVIAETAHDAFFG
ncbi:hypothetical protein BRARA_C01902 [Brassica rapa]|uniref:DC1 domain-containing protein n=1 Tax=Brassica campestris TaxID=3711 RepID=A0A397ZW86_BRACM|nr:uncharacterized protein LOC125606837 [Brassica napus]RID69832.1 hypothetical protein BRARA_C01902 [Brassica rapa]